MIEKYSQQQGSYEHRKNFSHPNKELVYSLQYTLCFSQLMSFRGFSGIHSFEETLQLMDNRFTNDIHCDSPIPNLNNEETHDF